MVSLWDRSWSRPELLARVGRLEQIAGVQLVEAADGAERGVRLLRFSTGSGFGFEVLVGRGFDIGRAWLGGRPLAWWSPVGLIAPGLDEPAGIGWFRGFPGGLVSTCGLDHTLLGGTDDAKVFNYPHRTTESYGLHGRYTGLPARPRARSPERRYTLEIGALSGAEQIDRVAGQARQLAALAPRGGAMSTTGTAPAQRRRV